MPNNMLQSIVEKSSDSSIAEKIISSFFQIQNNFRLKKYKYSGLEAGHFVEAVRRLIEFKLFGKYTPFNKSLSKFNEGELQKYGAANGEDGYKLLIPRVLLSIYTLRNKREIGHLNSIKATEIDTTFILYACKWVLAEIIRLESNLDEKMRSEIIDQIISKEVPFIWETSEFKVIADPRFKTKERAILTLYKQDGITLEEIATTIRYSNKSRLKIYLSELFKEGLLHEHAGLYYLLPGGQEVAEALINDIK